ncbi:HAD family hydrolase [Rhodopseudomonas sp. P2A-2r]|uniref:HAD family hydrolase n=1 Tax=unclassified Rhodopseudomonas TaxID=2638247 RepID=UPI002234CA54|nr:HAD family hydrolase [Rhodopseudomonas sp. P2A-2r]UZE47817.1 HAD family hydrolase [Rhodopseudomonas sp. P2A-2r]
MDAIFLDLDGTLTDPKVGITRSIQHALAALDQPVPAEQDLLWCIGPPLITSFRTMLGDEARAARAVTLYRERFSDIGLYENKLYDGIHELLTGLKAAGPRLFVATSKAHVFASRIIEHFGLAGYFEHVYGAELDGTRGEKTALLHYALDQRGLAGNRAVMVGDRSFDMIGARNNAMTPVGVLYGYGNEQELRGAGAAHVCVTPQAVGVRLAGLLGATKIA